jgi:beta-lactamase regulating signal transducer with metallopeptidase domain
MLNTLLWNLLLTAGLAMGLAGLCHLPSLGRRPALRHWLWLLLLLKIITPPLIAVPLLPATAGSEDTAAMATPTRTPTEQREPAFDQNTQATLAVDDRASVQAGSDAGDVEVQELPSRTQDLFLGGLLAVSLIGTGVLATVHGTHAVKLYRWLRRAGTENALLAQCCAEVASSFGVCGVARSCVIDARTTPLLLAWGRPLVVMPRQFIDDLSPQQLRSIVAHEFAHLVRRDHWANAFVFMVKTLLWWNPVVWWADRELRAAQELCCDAMAIACCKASRHSYATTLLKALDFIQAEPVAPRALATGMGSQGTILRRFEMIAKTHVSYQLSRWTSLILLALAIPEVCIPVRGQEKGPAAADTQPIDPKVKELGEAVHKRLTTWSDAATLVLKNGQTARMKVKKNVTPVAAIQITPHFVAQGTAFDLEGVDAAANTIGGTKYTSMVIHNPQGVNMGLGIDFLVAGESFIAKIHLSPTRLDKDTVRVQVKALFTRPATAKEIEALRLTQGKSGQSQLNFQELSRWITEYQQRTGRYPKTLKELDKPLPKDVYSRTGEDYRYEPQQNRFLLSGCGKDGVYGNDDDEIFIFDGGGASSGQRHDLYPLAPEKDATAKKEAVGTPRPRGHCSISGKVVSATSGEPIKGARIYLHYGVTHGTIFVNTAADGTFVLKDIPKGPFSLASTHTAGYQKANYNPEHNPGPWPEFSLKDGEHRSGIVLKAKQACRISGKIVDEKGHVPENIDTLTVLAWFKQDDGKGYESEQARVDWKDGSYLLDGLADKPAYVMAIDWQGAKQGNALPPIYYPSTFFRGDAKLITFDKTRSADNINITLRKEGGLMLEGTVRDDTGKPVSEAFVVVHRRDMLFDFVTAYTDQQGHYQIQGLGDGQFLIHVDAVHRGLIRTRTPLDLDRTNRKTERNLTLPRGVLISGKFVDEKGKVWRIGESYGVAHVIEEKPKKEPGKSKPEKNLEQDGYGSFSLTHFWNKHRPADILEGSGGTFFLGKGNYYEHGDMLFPTKSTFVIQGMTPGHTVLDFGPKKERQKVVKILHDGQDVSKSGIDTKPGQEIKDVAIVIGSD